MDRAPPASPGPQLRPNLPADGPGDRLRTSAPWLLACLVALAAHGGLYLYLTQESATQAPAVAEPAAVMIDMSPEVQQAFSQNDAAVGQPMQEAAAEPPPPPDEPKPDMTPPVEDSPSEAVAPLPPKPPETPKVEKKVEKKPIKKIEKPKKPVKQASRQAAERTASAPRSNEHAERTTARSAGVSNNSPAAADWRSQVAAAINRVKRYPSGAFGAGSSTVRVTVASSGAITGVGLVGSSGSADFDSEAVAAVHRVGAFPPPPQGATSVPLRLNFHR